MLLKRWQSNERGTSIVEFSLVAPVLFIAGLGIVELGLMYSAQNILESATYKASRTGRIGYVEGGKSQDDTVRELLNSRASIIMDTDKVVMDKLVYSNFDEIGLPEPYVDDSPANGQYDVGEAFDDINDDGAWSEDRGRDAFGVGGEIAVYTVTYPWPVFTPLFGNVMGQDGVVTLEARAVVKNEPF